MLWFACSSADTPIYLVPKGKSTFKHIKRIITGQREPWKSGQGDRKSWTVPTLHLLSKYLYSQNQPTLKDEYTATLNCSSFSTGISFRSGQFRGSLFMAVGVGRTEKSGPRALLTLYWCHDQCPQSSLPLKKADVSETDYRWLSWLHKGQMEISRGSLRPPLLPSRGASGGALPSQSQRQAWLLALRALHHCETFSTSSEAKGISWINSMPN